jgi:MFS family permease
VSGEPGLEEAEEAYFEGDYVRPGTASAALHYRDFRLVWGGTFLSNIGTWMQNIALGVLGYKLTKSAAFVGVLGFAQLGPLLLLALPGGALADAVDRRLLLVWMQAEQLVFSVALAFIAASPRPSKLLLVGCVAVIGIGNALSGPALAALLPTLVARRDLPGAVSLQSVQMNLARVVGPALGGVLLPLVHFDGLFALNAVTYVFAVLGLLLVRESPTIVVLEGEEGPRGWSRLVGGFRVARHDPLVRAALRTIAVLSFFCLPFIGLMPVLAEQNLGVDSKSLAYGLLYAAFGFGAACGAVSVGTVLAGQPRGRVTQWFLAGFTVMLAVFAFLNTAGPAYPVAFLVGVTYFGAVTALSTALQEHLDDSVRGRVMALWIMGFGGVVPLGLLAGGWVAKYTSITFVIAVGAGFGLLLTLTTRIRPRTGTGTVPALRG